MAIGCLGTAAKSAAMEIAAQNSSATNKRIVFMFSLGLRWSAATSLFQILDIVPLHEGDELFHEFGVHVQRRLSVVGQERFVGMRLRIGFELGLDRGQCVRPSQ